MSPIRSGSLRRFRGFTLVEVLVAIGIIALLIGILVPAIGALRENSSRAVCLSNLRQVFTTLQLYAQDNSDGLPIGYRAGTKQWNSMFYSATSGKFCLWGTLYQTGYVKSPAVWYCPVERDPQSAYNTSRNPWPPGQPGANCYAGYAGRPDVQLPDSLQTVTQTPPLRLPKFTDFFDTSTLRPHAILADLPHTPARVTTRHQTGINVIDASGGGRWVWRSSFDADLAKCPAISKAANPYQDQVWRDLDNAK